MQEVAANNSPSERVRRGMRRVALVVSVPAALVATIFAVGAYWHYTSKVIVRIEGQSYALPATLSPKEASRIIGELRVREGHPVVQPSTTGIFDDLIAGTEAFYEKKFLDASSRHTWWIEQGWYAALLSAAIAIGWFVFWTTLSWVVRGFMKD